MVESFNLENMLKRIDQIGKQHEITRKDVVGIIQWAASLDEHDKYTLHLLMKKEIHKGDWVKVDSETIRQYPLGSKIKIAGDENQLTMFMKDGGFMAGDNFHQDGNDFPNEMWSVYDVEVWDEHFY